MSGLIANGPLDRKVMPHEVRNMKLDEKSRAMKRMMEGMRALSADEIAAMQRKAAPGMMNCQDSMRGAAGMQNFWASEPDHWRIPEPPKPTFWQRMKRLFVMHNASLEGRAAFGASARSDCCASNGNYNERTEK